ncbi:SDR family NAD(P)-dependent oxidoreductase [Bacteroidales bacterium OttesenSCG-928-K03]|nr:SDR family NAD(P)-dependent oxidoreductase [Odoribacter sp. OttesenSCG-928-L07]MDL2242318.1 SDR family NAD(P)-dependent oxidoreductase [Bacteroidales bacterium OttesenSCG-928-K03]
MKQAVNIEKRVIIVGATSGIGLAITKLCLERGYIVGAAGRNLKSLNILQEEYPEKLFTEIIDVTQTDAVDKLNLLLNKTNGMDLYIHSAGVSQRRADPNYNVSPELFVVNTNCVGFTRMVDRAFEYFEKRGCGQIAAITSMGGTKGTGLSAIYSATKKFQSTYLEALNQLIKIKKIKIKISDIQPGIVDTPILGGKKYPMMLSPERAAKLIMRAIDKKRKRKVIDFKYAVGAFFWRLIPFGIWVNLPIKYKTPRGE